MSRVIRQGGLAVALLAAAMASAEEPAHAPAADAGVASLRFGWTAPLRARVSYRRTRTRPDGVRSTFTARYETRVEAEEEGLRITTHGTSWRGDLPLPRALARDAIRASEAVVQRVRKDGKFAGLLGVEDMRPVLTRVFEDAKVPPEAAERAVLLALGAVRTEAEEVWNLAVGFWTGADLVVGERYALQSEGELPLLPGVRAAQAVEFGVRRRVPCAAGEPVPRCVELTLRSAPDRAALARAAGALLARLAPGARQRPEEAAEDLSAESELVLVTDPATLLPRRMAWTKAVRLGSTEAGPPRAELVDRSEWDYRYLAPEPPRRKRARPPAAAARPPPPSS